MTIAAAMKLIKKEDIFLWEYKKFVTATFGLNRKQGQPTTLNAGLLAKDV
jgi:hypothetical protein